MSETQSWGGTIRKLWPTENDKFRDHLLRLDKKARHLRFGHGVSDEFILDYAARTNLSDSLVWGYFEDAEIHAVAELRKLGEAPVDARWGDEAEAAFSVESVYQDRGIGSELMGRVIRAARNRHIAHLFVCCLSENAKMQRIAGKHHAKLSFEYGEVLGDIIPANSNYATIMGEAMEDRLGFAMAVFDLQKGFFARSTEKSGDQAA